MLEIHDLSSAWPEQDSLEFSTASLEGWATDAPIWDGLDAYLDQACMAVME